jgi:hypothetical protein
MAAQVIEDILAKLDGKDREKDIARPVLYAMWKSIEVRICSLGC